MTETIAYRPATPNDLEALLPLMRGYCRDDGQTFDAVRARNAASRLLSESQWGCVLLAERNGAAIGYTALCIGFSIEMGGNDAFVDELYVEPAYRGQGIGRRLLAAVESIARDRGVCALHLEVDREKSETQNLYVGIGFDRRDRYYLMTKRLA